MKTNQIKKKGQTLKIDKFFYMKDSEQVRKLLKSSQQAHFKNKNKQLLLCNVTKLWQPKKY